MTIKKDKKKRCPKALTLFGTSFVVIRKHLIKNLKKVKKINIFDNLTKKHILTLT
jgi:hypothetical protein